MSRSRKKHPIIKDHNKGMKRIANHKVRRTLDVPNGKAYRKIFGSYDICDWRFWWNPKPRYSSWGGKIVKIDPEPEWRVRMK
jgi:hypothetical protein